MHMNDYKIFFLNYIKVTQYTTKKEKECLIIVSVANIVLVTTIR